MISVLQRKNQTKIKFNRKKVKQRNNECIVIYPEKVRFVKEESEKAYSPIVPTFLKDDRAQNSIIIPVTNMIKQNNNNFIFTRGK